MCKSGVEKLDGDIQKILRVSTADNPTDNGQEGSRSMKHESRENYQIYIINIILVML